MAGTSTRKTIDSAAVLSRIAERLAVPRERRMSLRETLDLPEYRDAIVAMKEGGYTLREMAALLIESGFPVKETTALTYLADICGKLRAPKRRKPKSKPKAPTARKGQGRRAGRTAAAQPEAVPAAKDSIIANPAVTTPVAEAAKPENVVPFAPEAKPQQGVSEGTPSRPTRRPERKPADAHKQPAPVTDDDDDDPAAMFKGL